MENFTSNSRCPSSPEISGDLASLGPFPTGSPGSPWTRVGVCAPQFITVPIHLAWATQVVLVVKNPLTIAGDARDADLIPRLEDGSGNGNPLQKIPWTEEPGRLQSWGCKESDTTEQLNIHTSTSTQLISFVLSA